MKRNVPFAPYGKRGMLDVYTSTNTPESGAPVLLQVHGGGWMIGKKEQQGLALMEHLAAKGWVCVAVNYRLAPRDRWPAQIVDVKQAIAWIKEHIADYGGDPDYVAITGGSAGGHLTALTALTPNDPAFQPGFEEVDTTVQVAVPHYGVYDMAGASGLRTCRAVPRPVPCQVGHAGVVRRGPRDLRGCNAAAPGHARRPRLLRAPRPQRHARRRRPGARSSSQRLRETSKRSVVYAELPHAQHAFDVFPSIRSQHIVRAIDRYLHWHWNTLARGAGDER